MSHSVVKPIPVAGKIVISVKLIASIAGSLTANMCQLLLSVRKAR